jgi:plastocyanin
MSERLVVDAATKGVKNVLVYLPRPSAVNEDAKKSATAKAVEFDQKHCVFEPHVMGLMAGVPVTLKSSDPIPHNVNVKLKKSSFNQTIAAGQTVFTPQDAERTPGQVVCDIHPWMSAWWMVLDHPYSAVTDAQGYYEIKNVPAGTQKVVVWQEAVKSGGFVTPASGEDVVIKAGDATVKDFTIDPGKLLPAG